jgi:hypothetical protein
MAYGQIVLAGSKSGFVPRAIKFLTKSKFSHSLITAPDMVKLPMCVEAAENGVSVIRFDQAYTQNSSENIEIWEVLVSNEAKDNGLTHAFDKLEKGYGFLELPWFIWRAMNKLVGRDIKSQNNWSRNRIYLVNTGLGKLFDMYGRGAVAPQDISDVMNANPKYFKKVFSNF